MKKLSYIILCLVTFTPCFAQERPSQWQFLKNDSIKGINREAAYAQLTTATPPLEIVVALLNTGVDATHSELKNALWVNTKETTNNKIDDDKNGYVDDVFGWNFIGSKDGVFNLTRAGTQAFREYKRLRAQYKDVANPAQLPKKLRAEYAYYKQMESEAGINSYILFAEYLGKIASAFHTCDSLLAIHVVDKDHASQSALDQLADHASDNPRIKLSLEVVAQRYMLEDPAIIWRDIYVKHRDAYQVAVQRIQSLDRDEDPRMAVGDEISNFKDIYYGNGNTSLHDSGQATAIAGVIAAQGNNQLGVEGVFPAARIMPVRILPEGDPYDKDITSGIKYAVDNGAKVIHIGFVKSLSLDVSVLRKAVEYAGKRGVLIVCPAGDNKKNNDLQPTYPPIADSKGRRYDHVLVVGASGPNGHSMEFSNYGPQSVDLFAPGTFYPTIYPDNQYVQVEGTDVAAAVVAGVAAMIYSYFPEMTATQVRQVLIESAYPIDKKGGNLYSGRCVSKGVVDMAKAIEISRSKR